MNFLEQLVAEWYEYQGYFVRRNVRVAPRAAGGHEGELDVVAFNPVTRHLVHIEPSMDALGWDKREERYRRKFALGRQYIPALFKNLDLPPVPEQIALLVIGANTAHKEIGGGKVVMIKEFMEEIRKGLEGKTIMNAAVPEQFVILRSLQFARHCWG